MRKFSAAMILSLGLAFAACNTVDGVGQDVESVGDTVSDAAN